MKDRRVDHPVTIRITKASDTMLAVCSAILTPLFVCGVPGFAWNMKPSDVGGGRGSGLLLIVLNTVGWPGVAALIAFIAYYFACLGAGAAWRLLKPGPAIVADAAGIHFHGSLGPAMAPWRLVRSVRTVPSRPMEVEVRLANRFWSTSNFLWSSKVRLNHRAAGLSVRELEDCADAMTAWRRSYDAD